MKTLIKVNNLAFAFIFLALAIVEFIGFLGGRNWCGWLTIPLALFAAVLFAEYYVSKNSNHAKRTIQNRRDQ